MKLKKNEDTFIVVMVVAGVMIVDVFLEFAIHIKYVVAEGRRGFVLV